MEESFGTGKICVCECCKSMKMNETFTLRSAAGLADVSPGKARRENETAR
jgi:hypothetical protein